MHIYCFKNKIYMRNSTHISFSIFHPSQSIDYQKHANFFLLSKCLTNTLKQYVFAQYIYIIYISKKTPQLSPFTLISIKGAKTDSIFCLSIVEAEFHIWRNQKSWKKSTLVMQLFLLPLDLKFLGFVALLKQRWISIQAHANNATFVSPLEMNSRSHNSKDDRL